jgi:isochorismate synthase
MKGMTGLITLVFLGEINCREERTRSTQGRNTEAQVYKTIIRNTRLYVNLRCLRLEEKTGTVFVGGGIVNSSDPDKEWQETVDKSSTMLRIL